MPEDTVLTENHERLPWDSQLCECVIDSIDEDKVKAFVDRAGLAWDSLPNVLEKLGLLMDGKLVNTAPLFFSKKAPAKLRCAVFGTSTDSFIIDRREFDGNILELIEEAQKYILKNIHIGMRLEGLYRVDVPEIAVPALREAIINAFCHRDYRDPEYVQVAVYKDRVEIRNPGTLFGGLTIEALRKEKISRRRNPLIAQMLTRIQMVEAWGRGMSLILDNAPDVEFKEVAGLFIASFARPSLAEEPHTADASQKVRVKDSGTSTITSTKKHIGEPEQALPTEAKVHALIQGNPTITLAEIADNLGLTKAGVRYHTDRLQAKGVLRRHGRKNGFWETF